MTSDAAGAAPVNGGGDDLGLIAAFVLPLVVYMGLGSLLEPSLPKGEAVVAGGTALASYPWMYGVKLLGTALVLAFFWPKYRELPKLPRWESILVGLVGAVVWIALCEVVRLPAVVKAAEPVVSPLLPTLKSLGLAGDRPELNPWALFGGKPAILWTFLLLRFVGLALLVPLVEELFLRGFLMRYLERPDFAQVPFHGLGMVPLGAVTLFSLLTHPAIEWLAVLAWFSLVTWWMLRTKSFWDCVVVHAVTNLALGLYVAFARAWHLW